MCRAILLFVLSCLFSFAPAFAQQTISLSAGSVTVKGVDHAAYIDQPDLFGGTTLHFILFPSAVSSKSKDAVAESGSVQNLERIPGVPKPLGRILVALVPGVRDCDKSGIRGVTVIFERGSAFEFPGDSSSLNLNLSGGSDGIKAMACALGAYGGYGLDSQGVSEVGSAEGAIPITWKVGIAGSFRPLKKG